MRRFVHAGLVLAVLLSGAAAYASAGPEHTDTTEAAAGVSDARDQATAAPPQFERSDCLVQDAVCRSECSYHADEKRCLVRRCEPQLLSCTASLPVGKAVSLPAACVTADQEAVRRLERQGELMDADPTLFAESFNALVRARIACRAGLFSEALNIYDEVQESMAVKRVQDHQARERKR